MSPIKPQVSPIVSNLIAVGLASLAAWTPSALNVWHDARRKRRAAFGLVLATVLEVRRQLLVRHEFARVMRVLTNGEAQAKIFGAFVRVFPSVDTLGKDYGEAIYLLSQESPVLAYRMRHLDKLVEHVGNLPNEVVEFMNENQSDEDNAIVAAFLDNSYPEAIRILEDAALELSLLHDIRTRLRVGALFRNETTFKEFFVGFIHKMPEPDRNLVIQAIPSGFGFDLPE